MSALGFVDLNFGPNKRKFYFRRGSSDEAVVKSVLINREYDLAPLKRTAELIEYGRRRQAENLKPLIVDAGANIGAAALHFRASFPTAVVVAIEPEPANFKLLRDNLEGLDVEAVQAGVASRPGRMRVVDPGEGDWGFRTEPASDSDSGPALTDSVTVNDIYARYARETFPFIAKLDIEGAERDVFSANTEWVARTPLIIVELHDWMLPKSGTARPFLRCIADLDRDFVHIGENVYSIANRLD
jgi:FkbM family methyltransferase